MSSMLTSPAILLLHTLVFCAMFTNAVQRVSISLEEQTFLLREALENCSKIAQLELESNSSVYCPTMFDTIGCFQRTRAGSMGTIRCPNYVNGFIIGKNATRCCNTNGSWCERADYSPCANAPRELSLVGQHHRALMAIYSIGYSLSFIALIVAIFLLTFLRRLHCKRNWLHVHLFFSFILRGLMTLLKDALASGYDEQWQKKWQCRCLTALFQYAMCANHFWISVEAVFLVLFIRVFVWREPKAIWPFVCAGWLIPCLVVLVVTWSTVKVQLDNVLCWDVPSPFEWVMRGPIVLTIGTNVVLFIYISFILYNKLQNEQRASHEQNPFKRHKRLIRSTLLLIPLFGLHYVFFICIPDKISPTFELVTLYVGFSFNSLQGFLVAILFCFMNTDVHSEITRLWQRRKTERLQNRCGSSHSLGKRLMKPSSVPVEMDQINDRNNHLLADRRKSTVSTTLSNSSPKVLAEVSDDV